MTLGGAMALLATIRHGHQLATDEHGHAARVRIWCNVFNVACKTKEIQDHLGLEMHQTILDQ